MIYTVLLGILIMESLNTLIFMLVLYYYMYIST